MVNPQICTLRYCRPAETDWRVEELSHSDACIRKQTLEKMGCVVELVDPLTVSANARHARLGALLDPRPLMN